MTDHLRRIRAHMALESRGLLLEAERARLFDHNTNRGTEAEQSITRWLRARLAPDYLVSSGEIIDSFEAIGEFKSRQQDGIVHRNSAEANRFLLPSGMRLVPIETVAAVVEVKLTLTKEEFERADAAARETSRLRLRPHRYGKLVQQMDEGSASFTDFGVEQCTGGVAVADPAFTETPVVFSLFAFGGIERLDTIRDWMKNSTISLVCCLSAGCVIRDGYLSAAHTALGSSEGAVEAGGEDALWHFSETLGAITKKHATVLGHFRPDFEGYAPYPKSLVTKGSASQ